MSSIGYDQLQRRELQYGPRQVEVGSFGQRMPHFSDASTPRAGTNAQAPSSTIQYVFIDESQRDSKRLKITRACESCRRRKVKCDAPHMPPGEACTSCKRLLVDCVLQQQQGGQDTMDNQFGRSLSGSGDEADPNIDRRVVMAEPGSLNKKGLRMPPPKILHNCRSMASSGPPSASLISPVQGSANSYSTAQTEFTDLTSPSEYRGVDTLTRIFGDFNIALDGRAVFVNDTFSSGGLSPSIGDCSKIDAANLGLEPSIPYPVSFQDVQPYLPPDNMARQLIDFYFEFIHPSMPLLNKTKFYNDWLGRSRHSMSPFLLISVFACSAEFFDKNCSNPPSNRMHSMKASLQGLLGKYRDLFQDCPRLSTLQAEMINLKTREAFPETIGYFYKSWYHLGSIIRMGKDLRIGRLSATSAQDPDSISGRRIWQICLIMDQLMGSAQGREMQLNMKEVDLTLLSEAHSDKHGLDAAEVSVHNDFVHLVGLYKILRRCTEVLSVSGIKFPFAAEPQYAALAKILAQWCINLPVHLKFNGQNESNPPSRVVAQLHLTYNVITCIVHRPWVVSTGEYGRTGEWREHLRLCKEAACKSTMLLEVLLKQHGDMGVQSLLRGEKYATYAAVIATMIHVVCLTCPEDEFSEGSQRYFHRASKVLERLSSIDPTQHLNKQLLVLNGMFGVDPSPSEARSDAETLSSDISRLQPKQQSAIRSARDVHPLQQPLEGYPALISPNTGHPHTNTYFHPDQGSVMYYDNSEMLIDSGDTGGNSSPSTTIDQTPPLHGEWNPAGLIGPWDQTFPPNSMTDTSQMGFYPNSEATYARYSPNGSKTHLVGGSLLSSRSQSSRGVGLGELGVMQPLHHSLATPSRKMPQNQSLDSEMSLFAESVPYSQDGSCNRSYR